MTDATTTPGDGAHRAAVAGAGPTARGAWVRLVVGSLCQSALATLVLLALWAALPALLGWQPTTVSSGSMMPRLHVGDVAVARPLSGPPALQQVLLFADPDHPERLRLHRFVAVDSDGRLVTRGDANKEDDSSTVSLAAVRGVAVLRVPSVALPVVWLREGRWVELGLVAGALVLVLAGSRLAENTPLQQDAKSQKAGTGPDRHRRASRGLRTGPRKLRLRSVLVLLAVATAAVLASTLATNPAWASYAGNVDNPASTYSSASYYRCANAVLPHTPSLYYALNETGGTTITDSSPNGRTGSFVGTLSTSASGVCTLSSSTAVQLNGTSTYITQASTTAVSAPNTFTVQAWFKTTTTRGGRIAGFGSSRTGASASADRHVYLSDSGQLFFGVQTGNNQRAAISSATGVDYSDGRWHLVTASLSSAGMRLSVDGALVATRTQTTSGISYTGFWRFGYDTIPTNWSGSPSSPYLAGALQEVAVFPIALSAQAITDIYNTGQA